VAFSCTVCGEMHAGETRDIRMTLPEPIFRLDEEERSRLAYVEDDFAVLNHPDGDRHFVRALLELPVAGEDDYFGYGAWIEVSEEDVAELGELWHDEAGAHTEPFAGRLANELSPYAFTEGLPLRIRLRDVQRLPLAELDDGEHELVRAQRHGISPTRAHQLAAIVG
jgi:hypothetical protein